METTKTLRVAFVKAAGISTLKAVAEDGLSVSVPVAYRASRKENAIETLTLTLSKNGKFYVAVGLSAAKKSSGSANAAAMALFAAADAEKAETPAPKKAKKA